MCKLFEEYRRFLWCKLLLQKRATNCFFYIAIAMIVVLVGLMSTISKILQKCLLQRLFVCKCLFSACYLFGSFFCCCFFLFFFIVIPVMKTCIYGSWAYGIIVITWTKIIIILF